MYLRRLIFTGNFVNVWPTVHLLIIKFIGILVITSSNGEDTSLNFHLCKDLSSFWKVEC